MITSDIIDANDAGIGVAAAKAGSPLDHVDYAIGSNFEIDRPVELKGRKERIDFQYAAVVIDFHLFDVVARPFPNEKALIKVSRQFCRLNNVGVEVVDGSTHGGATAGAVELWELNR